MDRDERRGCIGIVTAIIVIIVLAFCLGMEINLNDNLKAEAVKRDYAEWYYPENSNKPQWRWKELPEKKGEK